MSPIVDPVTSLQQHKYKRLSMSNCQADKREDSNTKPLEHSASFTMCISLTLFTLSCIVLSVAFIILRFNRVPYKFKDSRLTFLAQILSDCVISYSYFVIPIALIVLAKIREDLPKAIFIMYGMFILACGMCHLCAACSPWLGERRGISVVLFYRVEVCIKVLTAFISLVTAISSIRLIPMALTLPSPSQLSNEIRRRKCAQTKLKIQCEQMKHLSAALKKIRNSINSQEIVDTSCEEITHLLKAAKVSIYKINGDIDATACLPCSSSYTTKIGRGPNSSEDIPICNYTKRVISSEEALVYSLKDNLDQDNVMNDYLHENGSESMICCKISYQSVPTALVAIHDSMNQNVRAVEELCGQIGIALQHAITNEQLQIDRDQAQKSSTEKSSFLLMMSHEVKTPLHAINGMNALLKATHLTPEQQECVRIIDESGDLLLGIINSFLDLSKLESTKLELEKVPFNLHSCLEAAVHLFIINAKSQKNICVEMNRDPWLPMFAVGDRYRIQQVLINLLSNAVKFTDMNGKVTVNIKCIDEGMSSKTFTLEASIQDNGIGMNEEQVSRLFQPFSQVHSSGNRRRFGGTGLGLAICKRLCNLMNGDISVESKVGKGSVFNFHILLDKVVDDTDGALGDRARRRRSSIAFPRRNSIGVKYTNILIADDNLINQKLAVAMMRKLGYQNIEVVSNGKLAVEAVKRKNLTLSSEYSPYDIILCDLQMPEMDGLAAVEEIRKLVGDPNIPYIIALTANVQDKIEEDCLRCGFNAFLSKPFKMENLERILRQAPALQDPQISSP